MDASLLYDFFIVIISARILNIPPYFLSFPLKFSSAQIDTKFSIFFWHSAEL